MVDQNVSTFSEWDYVVFGCMLLVSAGIGVFHACVGEGQKDTKQYLVGGRSMSGLPVGMSLVASFMSAITVLGTPAEIYNYGTMFWWFALSYLIVSLLVAFVYMPLFYKLHITSVYEYLELRFNRHVRLLGMITFQCQMTLYMGIAIYAPALALNQVTNFPLWGTVWALGIVCTFYCTIGGIKAVIWTDVFQLTVMVAGFLMIIVKGSINAGGLTEVWRRAEEGGRIDFVHFEADPRIRHTFWSICVGGTLLWLAVYGVNQSQVQRYLSCRTLQQARISLYFNIFGLAVVITGAVLAGLVMYAEYRNCDPFSAGWVKATDQLIPYMVMDILGQYPGLPGVFVAAMFSGALSTVSSGLNALAAVVAEDVVKPFFNPSESKYTWITKGLALSYGLISILMAYVASALGDVLSAALSIFGMVGGPLLGLFTLAMFFPWCNSKGAIAGLLGGLGFSFWVGIGAIINPPPVMKLYLSTENCSSSATTPLPYTTTPQPMTSPWTPEPPTGLEDWWYGMSYLWYSGVAVGSVLVIGLTTSFLTGAQKPSELEPGLISPVFDIVMCCLPAKWRRALWCGVRHDEEDTGAYEMKVNGTPSQKFVKTLPIGTPASDIDSTPMVTTSDIGVWTGDDKEYFRVNRKPRDRKHDNIPEIDLHHAQDESIQVGEHYDTKDEEIQANEKFDQQDEEIQVDEAVQSSSGVANEAFDLKDEESKIDETVKDDATNDDANGWDDEEWDDDDSGGDTYM
ncbi:sodium-coupled monocarboxylate transporter 1-like [Amphiura filiformis]|uniref:sodium-coupled monocarboxylate transporter 1-like n=1 Tax=Amphiura filiformis TaxID=82378 RepID=UPI003B210A48